MAKQPWETQQEREQAGQAVPDHYFVVTVVSDAGVGRTMVSADAARAIEAELDREPPPRWITFQDFGGERVRVRADKVVSIDESTAAGRALGRAFNRARKAEDKADGWEDGD